MPQGINPVTFTGKGKDGKSISVSLGRLHITSKGQRKEVTDGMHSLETPEVTKKNLACVVWCNDGKSLEPLAELNIDEDHFIRGLQHLFPNGELNIE